MTPNFNEEKFLSGKGYKLVAGVDEAGRGPLAGPVVAAAVCVNSNIEYRNPKKIPNLQNNKIKNLLTSVKDSKQLSPQKREEIYKWLIECSQLKWGVGVVSEKIIDKINILEATKLAMIKAVKDLKAKPDYLILDGKMKLNLNIPQKSIIKGDSKVFSCAAASIIAKVTRDRIMLKFHKKYSQYGFDIHKGYGTKHHIKMLKKYGPCKIHRKSFRPVVSYGSLVKP